MKKQLLGFAISLTTALAMQTAQAANVTMEFTASGFLNGGSQFPGFNGPVTGRISWDRANVGDPISTLTGIDLTIAGHTYSLSEVGVANNGTTQTAIGGLANGANSVVGSGEFNDFLLIFDRVNPSLGQFAYSIQGKLGAIWWFPTFTEARFVTQTVPEPAAGLLALAALGLLVTNRRRASSLKAA
jgi:MYXO-CTERM domain-containing protein